MTDYAKHLNPSQLEVVKTLNGPVLVIAGAGSGKTRVIEYRVLYLIQNNVSPQSILLLTFTRRAAREMLSRAARHDPRCNYVQGGTFHSFAFSILKKHSKSIGFDSFSILDEDDAAQAIQVCLRRLTDLSKEKRFPKKDTLRKIVSMSLNKDMPIEQVLESQYGQFLDFAVEINKIKDDYIRYKLEKNYFDYDDLLIYLKLLLVKNEALRKELSSKYSYIMVDEYQDTNRLQADITCLLAGEHKNVMIVGDDAQSIYGFRGASHENILEFPKHFPGCKVLKLEENYRSHQPVLDVANAVLANMRKKFPKHLVSAAKPNGPKPELLFFKDAYEEAEWVAFKIREFEDQGIDLSQQAVLFRSAYISIPLQLALGKLNIPYQVFGGLKFYETAHVKDLLSYFRVLVNPLDEISWMRILQLLEGIGPKTAEKVLKLINLSSPIKDIFKTQDKKSSYEKQLVRLGRLLERMSLAKPAISKQFDACMDYYYPILKEKFEDWQQRQEDLQALKQIAARYTSLSDFLADFTIEPPERSVAAKASFGKPDVLPLTISTIHSAKGLEWECVFLIGLIDGVLPVSFSLDDEEGIEEEQRLFYVAVTRAKKHLLLSVHHEGNGFGLSQFNRISRFVDSPNVLDKLQQKTASLEDQDW